MQKGSRKIYGCKAKRKRVNGQVKFTLVTTGKANKFEWISTVTEEVMVQLITHIKWKSYSLANF